MFPLGATSLEFGVQSCVLRSPVAVVSLRQGPGESLSRSVLLQPIAIRRVFDLFLRNPAPGILGSAGFDGGRR
jgi:hypothetical protein